ncbi:MAG: hypothetical protein ACRC10_06600 [Thermoguttaceae bacterium]
MKKNYEDFSVATFALIALFILLALFPVSFAQPTLLAADLISEFKNGPLKDVKEIVFAARPGVGDGHWYANFGYYADDENRLPVFEKGGTLAVYNLETGQCRLLIDDSEGSLRDPQVHYDAEKIIFSYKPGGTTHFHLYEIGLDGQNLRQLTAGDCDDIEPTYTADGTILFVSSRAKRWVQCWLTPVATLHACDSDGSNVRQLSANVEHDNTPWPLPNGQMLYTRWEYVDRSQVDYHHLWIMNPDGTRQTVFFGNMHPGIVYIDAKPVPKSEKVVASFSWGHGSREHAGSVGLIDPRRGPDDVNSAQVVSKERNYRDPWAFSETEFLAAQENTIVLMNEQGETEVLFTIPASVRDRVQLHEPRPVMRRERERIISEVVDPGSEKGQLVLIDVYNGRNMEGVKRGEIKKLLILESLPKPINFTGGMEPLTYGGSFTLERVYGTVPVEEDGSANFELPAMRSFFFVALDDKDRAVKRMQSFTSVMPGESTTCLGCHENRVATPQSASGNVLATKRPPSPVEPIAQNAGIPDVLDFPRDIQPILDRNCVSCHNAEKRDGNVSLVGDRTPLYTVSYYTITSKNLVADGRNLPKSNYPPRTLGSGSSRLLDLCDGSHYGVQPTEKEMLLLRLWCETGGTYPGTYAGLGCGMIGGYAENQLDRRDLDWPEIRAMQEVILKKCANCHTKRKNRPLATSPSDEIVGPPWVPLEPNDARRVYSRQLLYNLTNPGDSTLLLAPLAKTAGGYESCGRAVFANKEDPEYQTILAGIERTKQELDRIKRFDMPGFIPRPQYIREMKKFGILSPDHDPDQPVNTYDLEQQYWKSLWYTPR